MPFQAAPSSSHRALRISAERLRGVLLWLMGFAGAFVFVEPGPYEIVGLAGIFLFGVSGLSLRGALIPLALMLIVLDLGYAIAVVQVADEEKAVTWVGISIFLAVTALFYAAVVSSLPQVRLDYLLRGYTAAALVAALAAIAGYFHLLGGLSELFVLYDRARGTFNDPNVLGAFLVLPAALQLQRVLTERPVMRSGICLAVLLVALLLTFSRAAWGQLVLVGLIVVALSLASARSGRLRLRIVSLAVVGAAVVAILLAAPAPPSTRPMTWAISAASGAMSWAPSSAWNGRSALGRCSSTNLSARIRTTAISTPSCQAAGSRALPISR